MTIKSATELVFEEQFGHLVEVAKHRNWELTQMGEFGFVLVLPARDESSFGLNVSCEGFSTKPPTWYWCNPETYELDRPSDMPRGSGGYLHPSGRICAPWNRIAYKQIDPQGPHSDWELVNWMTNPKTSGHTTLLAMVLRLSVELMSERYQGRMG